MQPLARTDLALVLLTLAGAGVDAVMILAFNVLTAAQTGNTILLAVAIARGDVATGFSAAASVGAFVLGTIAGELTMGRATQAATPRRGMARALLAEMLVLVAVLSAWREGSPATGQGTAWVVAMAAFAMGLQSAVVLRLRGPTTTYISGTLATFGTGLVQWAFGRSCPDPSATGAERAPLPSLPWRHGLVWILYGTGAVLCGFLFLRFGSPALLVPLCAVGIVMAVNRSAAGPH